MSEDFLRRWSRRKLAAKAAPDRATPAAIPAPAAIEEPSAQAAAAPPAAPVAEPPLPPVESLTPESDFAPFMRPEVDAGLRRQALKTLFRDPRFNVMDGLDVYIDDYSKPDPLPEGWLEKMQQVARLGDYKPPEPEPEAPEEAVAEAEAAAAVEEVAAETPAPAEASNTSAVPVHDPQSGNAADV